MNKQIHVAKTPDGNWGAMQAGGKRRTFTNIPTQREAIVKATDFARKNGGMEVVIHSVNGRIRETNTIAKYDPPHIRG